MSYDYGKELTQREMLYANVNGDGEIESLTVPYKPYRSKLGKGWFAMYQEAMEYLAVSNLKNEQYRVLMYLFSKLDFDNFINISQTEMAESLKMSRPSASRSMKALEELDILRKGPKIGNGNTYRLNPLFAHKGKSIDKTRKEYGNLKRIK